MLGEFPSFESLRIRDSTSSGWYLNQLGGLWLTGLVDPELPLLPEYNRANSLTISEAIAAAGLI